jgi:hypothetical protein
MNRWRPTVAVALAAIGDLYPTMPSVRQEILARMLATAPAIRLRHVVVGRQVGTEVSLMIWDPDFHLRLGLHDTEDGLAVLDRVRGQILGGSQRPARAGRAARRGRR